MFQLKCFTMWLVVMVLHLVLVSGTSIKSTKDIVSGRYLVSKKVMTRSEALSYCRANGMVLVSVGNGIENNEVTQFLEFASNRNDNDNQEGVGFGWTSAKPVDYYENTYTWEATGEVMSFSNFDQELSNLVFTQEDWVNTGVILSPISEKWIVEMKTESHHALCEKL